MTGKITNLEEDMIEITTHPDNDVIYIDFAYIGIPDDIPTIKLSKITALLDIMVENQMVDSKANAKRLIKQGAVKINGQTCSDIFMDIAPESEIVLKVGKRRFLKIIP